MPSKADLYVKHRLNGLGSREAAREVGFETGVPGGHALKLYRAALEVDDVEHSELLRRLKEVEESIAKSKRELRRLRRLRRARRLLPAVRRGSK